MRILLQKPTADRQAIRYCQLILQKDLIDGWTLIKERGYHDKVGRIERRHFATQEAAEEELHSQRSGLIKRGYRVVFTQGQAQ